MTTHRLRDFARSARRFLVVQFASAFLAASFAALIAAPLPAQQPKPSEFQVKAAYLYNFGKFVEWPGAADQSGSSFEICVLGADPFGATLDATLAMQSIGGKTVAAKRISKPEDIDSCRILFISSSEEGRLKQVLAALDKTSVLTVSDIPRFSERGGMIGFVLQGDRIRFDVNLASAQDAHLVLSSELLKVASNVRKDAPGAY